MKKLRHEFKRIHYNKSNYHSANNLVLQDCIPCNNINLLFQWHKYLKIILKRRIKTCFQITVIETFRLFFTEVFIITTLFTYFYCTIYTISDII